MIKIEKDERKYWVGFSCFPQIGPIRFRHLLKIFGSAKEAWSADKKNYIKAGFSENLTDRLERFKKEFSSTSYFIRLKNTGVEVILETDKNYPKLLKETEDSPYILYVKKGNKLDNVDSLLDGLNRLCIAVVGTRKMSGYGKEVTTRLVTRLVDNNCTIVSGLALGIDSVAHRVALEAGGFTIAVLGGGLDNVYPPSNRGLAEDIIRSGQGAIISEYPLGFPYLPQNFPHRNRIIAGIANGVLVVEGTGQSGTLLTASAAARYGREVFAVPGPITSFTSQAPHYLLRNGAKLTENAEDVLEEFQSVAKISKNEKEIKFDSEDEKVLFNLLKSEPLEIDSIVRVSKLPAQRVLSTLTILELKGILKNIAGVYTIR